MNVFPVARSASLVPPMNARRPAPRVLALVSFLGLFLPAVPAAADVISDEEAECRDKTAGAACRAGGGAGHCAASSCSRNDYSDGPPPKQKQVECLVCTPGEAKAEEPTQPSTNREPAPTTADGNAGATAKGCGARIGEPSLVIGSSVLGLALLGLGLRRRA